MSNPITRAFFIGRATANLLTERAETAFSDLASELSKAISETQRQWEQFGEDVLARAEAEEALAAGQLDGSRGSVEPSGFPTQPADLQASLDDLRAEVAQLRSELQRYRSQAT
jgi:hypothetical protein